MPRLRAFDFQTGIQTSVAPTVADPVNPGDMVTVEYADDTYTARLQVRGTVADNTAVKAIVLANRADNQIVYNVNALAFYRFESSSTASDDGDLVLQPADLPSSGRWLKQEIFGSAGGFSAEWELGNNVPSYFKRFDGGRLVSAGGSKSNLTVSLERSGSSGSSNFLVEVVDSTGTVTDSATFSLASSSENPASSLASLSSTISYSTGDFIFISTQQMASGRCTGLRVKL